MNLLNRKKNVVLLCLFFVLSILPVVADNASKVVKLSRFVEYYDVEGLPDDYVYRSKGGQPDFGSAKIINRELYSVGVGTGVVVTKTGLILTNAHVTNAYASPIISEAKDAEENVILGADKKPLKRIIVNLTPSYMFVAIKGKDFSDTKICFAAKILYEDDDFNDGMKDRAILSVTNFASEDSEKLPVIGNTVNPTELNLDFVEFENSFALFPVEKNVNIRNSDKNITMAGFYDRDDSNDFVEICGEVIGYQNEENLKLFHSCWVPGGISGGGIFYDDLLVAINTWDYSENFSRPMSIAQPIEWFFEPLLKVSYHSSDVQIPSLQLEWLDEDPTEKNNAIVKFLLRKGSNNAIPVTDGKLVAFLSDMSISDVQNYKKVSEQLDTAWEIVRLLGFYSVEEVSEKKGKSVKYVERLKNVTTSEDLRMLINESSQKFFKAWADKTFLCSIEEIWNKDGKVAIALPKNIKLNLVYLDSTGYEKGKWTLSLNDDYVQGEYMLNVK